MVDPEVLAGFAAGDPDAVRAVYGDYGGLVYAVAYKTLGDRDLAEEATQQAFVQAWRASGSYDPAREMGSWLATIARRAAIDVYRREARRSHGSLDDADPADPALVTLPPSIDRVYDVWEVRRAIGTLDPDDAELVRFSISMGLPRPRSPSDWVSRWARSSPALSGSTAAWPGCSATSARTLTEPRPPRRRKTGQRRPSM